jgi:ribosome maturation factor RimP
MKQARQIEEFLTPVIERAGASLEEVKISPGGKHRLLTVLIDHEERHLTLDEVTEVSKAISQAIDESTEFGSTTFTLEVSSPGIDRPLTKLRHYRKNLGRLVTLTTTTGEKFHGRIESADPLPRINGRTFGLDEIKRAMIEIEFRRHDDANHSAKQKG